jgi:succinate-semialdehyde dehydrogenase/glutarate-semialdehyde dehydrogenase
VTVKFVDQYIDGVWLGSDGPRAQVHDPADGSVLAEVAVADVGRCLSAIDAASRALPAWSQMVPRDRSEVLRRAHELMVDERETLAELVVSENGKTLADARSEIAYAAEFFRWFAEEAVRVPGDMRRSPSGQNWMMVSHEPVGVSLLITPWNFPAAMATRKIAPALAAGCTVVLKPAMETPLTALALADLLERAGVPAGVVNVVTPSPPGEAVAAMLRDRRVRALSFTGSTEVGRILLREAADNVVKSSMELGGNAPFLVFDDADLEDAVEGVMIAKMRNGGAACTAANRILVQRGIADRFTEAFVDRMNALRLGPGSDPSTTIGPMVTAAERDRVAGAVAGAVEQGARLATSGGIPDSPGYFHPATVLTGVPADSPLTRAEIFGPVAPMTVFGPDDEGIAIANDSDSGLIAYAYTSDLQRGFKVARQLEAGMVGLNRGVVSDPAAPFGGTKHSGLGREGAQEGLLEFLEAKYVAVPYA